MRRFQLVFALLSLFGCAFSACSNHGTGGQTSTGGGGAPDCSNIFYVDPGDNPDAPRLMACNACLQQECCAELSACANTDAGANCHYCALGNYLFPECASTRPLARALSLCTSAKCVDTCHTPPDPECLDGGNTFDGGGCIPAEPKGGVTFADCTAPATAVLRGTIDGKPYNQTIGANVGSYNQLFTPFGLGVSMDGPGDLHLRWGDLCLYPDGPPVPVTGTVKLPGEDLERTVQSCSLLWNTMNIYTLRFNLVMDGGQITGCVR